MFPQLLDYKAQDAMQPRTPPHNSPSSPNNCCQSGTLLSQKQNHNLRKKFWYPSRYLQLDGLQISAEVSCFRCPIWGCDNRTHLVSPREPPKHQKRDQIAHWILMAPAAAVANFNTENGNLNCTNSRVCEDPSRSRLTEVMKMTTVFFGLHYWKIQ